MIRYENILEQDIDDVTFVVLDLETTGLKAEFRDRIVEIGAVKLQKGKVVDKINTFINPLRPITPGAHEINKIHHLNLVSAPLFKNFSLDLLNFIKDSIIVAYNAPFDISFLKKEFNLAGIDIRFGLPMKFRKSNFLFERLNPNYSSFEYRVYDDFSIKVIDVLNIVRNIFPKLPTYKLSYVSELLNINQKPTHRAIEDVFTTMEVFNFIINILKNFGSYKVKDLFDPDIYKKISIKRFEMLNTFVKENKNISFDYLDIQSHCFIKYICLPLKIDSQEKILEACVQEETKQFDVDRIFNIVTETSKN